MKIGFFGDSYVDVNQPTGKLDRKYHPYGLPWSYLLLEDFNLENVTSGRGGAALFHAIDTWNSYVGTNFDVAIFSLTWSNRIYSRHDLRNFNLALDNGELNKTPLNEYEELTVYEAQVASELFYKYFHSTTYELFTYKLMLEYILKLPEQFPNTKFIFLPCTEEAKVLSKEFFRKGCLVDFAFETLSNNEPNAPCVMPCMCYRASHLSEKNNNLFKDYVKNIILNYDQCVDNVVNFDYTKFDI